jgi:hypothetical protein
LATFTAGIIQELFTADFIEQASPATQGTTAIRSIVGATDNLICDQRSSAVPFLL